MKQREFADKRVIVGTQTAHPTSPRWADFEIVESVADAMFDIADGVKLPDDYELAELHGRRENPDRGRRWFVKMTFRHRRDVPASPRSRDRNEERT